MGLGLERGPLVGCFAAFWVVEFRCPSHFADGKTDAEK